MKVLHISTYDISGGAARAAYRLHKGLQAIGVTSQMLVASKASDDPSVLRVRGAVPKIAVRLARFARTLPLSLYKHRARAAWSVNWIPTGLAGEIAQNRPDIVHFHWIGSGFVPWGTLKQIHVPIVWTLHDMWAFTGGCHYDEGCGRYQQKCGACPQLGSSREADLSRWVWQRKRRAWQSIELRLVAPSRWLAGCVGQSSLFHDRGATVVPYGLDTDRFKPHSKQFARELLSLPQNKRLILFGAVRSTSQPRKGFQYLQQALQRLRSENWSNQAELVVFGASQPEEPPGFGSPVHYLGSLHDDISLALVYSAADLFVAPSTQDNLPNTIIEAMACGTPCIAFRIGGMPDMVRPGETGLLAEPGSSSDLAEKIAWMLQHPDERIAMGNTARRVAETEFALRVQAEQYVRLYREVLAP